MAAIEPTHTYRGETAELTDMATAANLAPLWTSSSLPDSCGFYMPPEDEPQQIAFASSASNVDMFFGPEGSMMPSHGVGVSKDCVQIGSNFVLYNPHITEHVTQMQQQQQLLRLHQTQPPIAYTLQYQQQQQYNMGTSHSSQIQTHSFQHCHDTVGGQYAQLCTPTASNGLNNTCYKSTSEVLPKIARRASPLPATDELFEPESPDSQNSQNSQTGRFTRNGSPASQSQSYREKNRLAASRCRERSKKFTDDLRTRDRELTVQRAKLVADVANLKEQVLELKRELLYHANCNCDLIQAYLTSAAKTVSGGVAILPPSSGKINYGSKC